MIRVAGYCRVSTDRSDQANSFQAQQRYFREYIAGQTGWELYEIYADEGITGTSTKKRAGFLNMIRDAHEGRFQLILTKEISRFSRNILDTVRYTRELKEIGVGVLFMTENLNTMDPGAEMLLTFMGTVAQEESRRTSIRVKWGQTRQMERGIVFGPSLLGYEVKDGELTVEPEGAQLVRRIFQKYAVEKKGTSVICRELREEGFRTPKGNLHWGSGQIVKILKNEKYAGDLVQKKTITPDYLSHEKRKNRGEEPLVILRDHHEGIIPRELWTAAQEELEKRDRSGKRVGGCSVRYAFSGKIRCGACGAVFVSRVRRRKDGTIVRRWGCSRAITEGADRRRGEGGVELGCDVGWLLRDEALKELVAQAIGSLSLDRQHWAEEIVKTAAADERSTLSGNEYEQKRVEAELERLERKGERAVDAYLSGKIGEEELSRIRREYERRREELKIRRERLRKWAEGAESSARERKSVVSDLLSGQRVSDQLCKTLVRSITVFKARCVELEFNHLPLVFTFEEGTAGMD